MGEREDRLEALAQHYAGIWKVAGIPRRLGKGREYELAAGFHVLEFCFLRRAGCVYATCGMATPAAALELHMFAPQANPLHVELLTIVAHYHQTGASLGLGHTVNFGRAWLPGSSCSYGLISLPYLDGPKLEEWRGTDERVQAQCLWLIPITLREREFKITHGLEALEQRFDAAPLDYLNPLRGSVV